MGDITKNFSYSEFERSAKANELRIDNSIPDSNKSNIKRLCRDLLQPICDYTGWVCIITSGYRCYELNKKVGGSETSYHRSGCAADCKFYRVENNGEDFTPNYILQSNNAVKKVIEEKKLPFTEMILYNERADKYFIHLAYNGIDKKEVWIKGSWDGADDQIVYPVQPKVIPYSLFSVPFLAGRTTRIPYDDFLDWLKTKYVDVDSMNKNNPDEFLSFSDGTASNFDRIIARYNPDELLQNKKDLNDGKVPFIKVGTVVVVPMEYIQSVIQYLEKSTLFMQPKEGGYRAYWTDNIKGLTTKDGYVGVDRNTMGLDYVQQKNLNTRVWIYMSSSNRVFDVTPYITFVQTNKQMKGGSFTLELSPVGNGIPNYGKPGYFVNGGNGRTDTKIRGEDGFARLLNVNDIVFIRFERLVLEDEPNTTELNRDLVWDMIGFIDTVVGNHNFESNMYSVSVAGRDFSKVFDDDGCYFIPSEFMFGNHNNFMITDHPDSPFIKRMVTGDYLELMNFQSIKSLISFIFNILSSVSFMWNDFVLNSCNRSWREEANEVRLNDISGVWKLFKVFVDPELSDRVIVDSSMINPQGTITDFLNKACQEPFVEWFVDTWGSGVDLIVRKPPFDISSILGVINSYDVNSPEDIRSYHTIYSEDVFNYNLSFDDRVYSWYRIVANNGLMSGIDESISLTKLPIFYLDEYVKLFGNKRYQVSDNYIHVDYMGGAGQTEKLNLAIQKLVSDFIFVIESTFYLPFSRKGTIVINGDRRIKVGSFVKLEKTNELFYVTGVSNEISFGDTLNRQTVLTVERGLRIDCISDPSKQPTYNIEELLLNAKEKDSVDIEGYLRDNVQKMIPNYFNIIRIDKIKGELNKRINNKEGVQISANDFLDYDQFFYFYFKTQWGPLFANSKDAIVFTGELSQIETNE